MQGDGKANDAASIRGYLSEMRGHGVFRLPRPHVAWSFAEPVIVPRGVQIVGDSDGMFSTLVQGLPSFPPGRDLFEFETGGQTYGNRIANMTLRPAPVPGCGAISYRPVNENSTAERWQGELENLRFQGTNTHNPYCVYIAGNVHSSRFSNLWGDPGRYEATHDTVLLKFSDGTDAPIDAGGLYASTIDRLNCTSVRGGFCAALRGKLVATHARAITVGLGTRGTPYLDLRNCQAATVSNVMIEGGGGRPMIRLEACRDFELTGFMLGRPVSQDPRVTEMGNGIEMIGCSNATVRGGTRWTSNASWSHLNYPAEPALALKVVTLDEDCERCDVEIGIGNIDTLATATADLGKNNRIRTRNPYAMAQNRFQETFDRGPV